MQALETLAALFNAVTSVAETVNGLSGILWLLIGGTVGSGYLRRRRRLKRLQGESDVSEPVKSKRPAA